MPQNVNERKQHSNNNEIEKKKKQNQHNIFEPVISMLYIERWTLSEQKQSWKKNYILSRYIDIKCVYVCSTVAEA